MRTKLLGVSTTTLLLFFSRGFGATFRRASSSNRIYVENGIMVHRHSDDALIENNTTFLNGDSGIALFDVDRTTVRNNLMPEPDPVDPTVTNRMRRNNVTSNYVHHCVAEGVRMVDGDENVFLGNSFSANGPELAFQTSTPPQLSDAPRAAPHGYFLAGIFSGRARAQIRLERGQLDRPGQRHHCNQRYRDHHRCHQLRPTTILSSGCLELKGYWCLTDRL